MENHQTHIVFSMFQPSGRELFHFLNKNQRVHQTKWAVDFLECFRFWAVDIFDFLGSKNIFNPCSHIEFNTLNPYPISKITISFTKHKKQHTFEKNEKRNGNVQKSKISQNSFFYFVLCIRYIFFVLYFYIYIYIYIYIYLYI